MINKIGFGTIAFIMLLHCAAWAQRGKDGNAVISSANTTINEYTTLLVDANTGDLSLTVQNSSLNSGGIFALPLSQGDLILIIQMQGASITGNTFTDVNNITYGLPKDSSWGAINSYGNAGFYDLVEVYNIPDPNTIEISCGLSHDYNVSGKTQIIRVPRYQNFTVNAAASVSCPAWNGSTGGVIAAEVNGTTVINGTVDASAKGFRGGQTDNDSGFGSNDVACTSSTMGGEKGESIAGYQSDYNIVGGRYCKGSPANGGGGGNRRNGGGGGGANAGDPNLWIAVGNPSLATASWANAWNLEWPGLATATSTGGGKGGYTASSTNQNANTTGPGNGSWGGDNRGKQGGYGGRPLDYSTGRVFLGGGGGAGDGDNSYAGKGGNGGGLVYLTCFGSVSGTGSVLANGENGTGATGTPTLFTVAGNDGSGGGGGGGAILLNSLNAISGIAIQAKGGAGGTQVLAAGALYGVIALAEGPGGGGGGGFFNCSQAYPANISGGANGTTNSPSLTEFIPNGATSGGNGETKNTLSLFDITLHDTSTCAGNSLTLTATVIGTAPVGGIAWFDAQYGGNLITNGNTFTTPPMFGTFTFWVGACPGNFRKPITVTVTPLVTNALAGANQQLCDDSTAMAANIPVTGTGLWTVISGTATILNPNSPSTSVTGLGIGTVQLQWTISSPGCPSSSDVVDIDVLGTLSPAQAGTDQQICTSSTTINATAPVIGSGTWSVVSGGGSIASPGNNSSSISGLSTGNNVFVWTVSNAVCPDNTDTVVVLVDTAPSVAQAGTNQNICSDSTQLAAITPSVGIGTWTLVSGSGTIQNPGSVNTDVIGLSAGINTFQWTVSNGICPSSTATVNINVAGQLSPAIAGTDQQICSASANLNATAPLTGTGSWTVIAGGASVASPNNNNSSVSGLTTGSNLFVWTVSNAVCPDNTDTLEIIVDTNPSAAQAGANQTICSDSTQLASVAPLVGTGVWTLVSGTGTIQNPGSVNTDVIGLSPGLNSFQWTVSNGACPSTSATVNINVAGQLSAALAGADQQICASTATLNATAPVSGTGNWTVLTGGGTVSNTSLPNAGVSSLSTGLNQFIWTVSNAICPDNRDTVSIIVDTNPSAAVAGSDQTVCSDSIQLLASVPAVGSGTWTLISGSGTIQNPTQNNTDVLALTAGTSTFVWTVTSGACPAQTDTVEIVVAGTLSNAVAGIDQQVCGTSASLSANPPLNGTGTWSVLSGGATLGNPSNPASTVSNLTTGLNTFVWTVSNAICPDNTDTVIVESFAAPAAADAGSDQTLCTSTTQLNAATPASGTGLWSLVSGSGLLASPNSSSSVISNLLPGTSVLVWTVSYGPCPQTTDTVELIVLPAVSPAQAGSDVTVCAGSYTLQAGTPTVGAGSWTIISGTGTLSSTTDPNAVLSGITGTVVLEWAVSFPGCTGSTDQITIVVTEPPSEADAGADIQQCGNTFNLNANTPAVGNGFWSIANGAANFSANNVPNPSVQVMSAGGAVLVWNIAAGNCPLSSDTVNLIVSNSSNAADAGPDVLILLGDSVQLLATGGTVSAWTPTLGLSCVACPNPVASPVVTTVYTVSLTDANGCVSFDSVKVEVDTTTAYYLPNAFSPNGDDKNNTYYFHGTGVEEFRLNVFDRWGNLLFETTDQKIGWDGNLNGKPVNAGIYVYYLEVKFKNGKIIGDKGNLNLFR